MAYVSVPPKPWLTPSSSHKGSAPQISEKRLGKMKLDDDDLGGYGSDDFDGMYSPTRNDTAKSSARRTGDRDERGKFLLHPDLPILTYVFY